jgi:hypothetical protein
MFLSGTCLLCVYGALRHPWLSFRECAKHPQKCIGREVQSFQEPRIGQVTANGFVLTQRDAKSVFVVTDTAGLKPGEFVGLKAVFHGPDTLVAKALHVASRRREKMAFSLLPAAAVVALFLRHFRVNRKTREIEPKTHA